MECQHISYQYPQQATGLVDLSGLFPEGQVTTIIGPNGAGKSTLLNVLARRLPPQQGTVLVAGKDSRTLSDRQFAQQVALVTQQHELFDELTVREVVATGRLPYHGLLSQVPPAEVDPYLEANRLADLADDLIQNLSGGQQQRVWLAAALAQEPRVLLLDEPTTYLDVHYQQALMAQLRDLAARGMTVIQVLHDINQAFRVSDWLWLLQDGRLVKCGTPAELRTAPLLAQAFKTAVEIVEVPKLGPYIVQLPK